MPYNTRRKSLSLPSLGIHVPTTAAARAAAAKSRASMSSNSSDTHAEHPSKRLKRAHTGTVPEEALEQTPPPSPQTLAASVEFDHEPTQIDLAAVNDDIVEAVIVQLQETANRPHLVKELATVLGQTLTSVQQSANPCAIISSRLASYLKRPNWSAKEPCPLAKELETVHPRRTYFFLTTHPRQPLPDFNASVQLPTPTLVTPSVSLTDDSVSDDVEGHRRQLSPSPEVDLSSNEFDEDGSEDDMMVPGSPIRDQRRQMPRDMRRNSPPLEKDEKEFTQTADGLLKRKLSQELPAPELLERPAVSEYGFRDEVWFGDNRKESSALVFASPAIKPLSGASRRDEDEETWFKFSKVIEWDRTAENIEIDELEYLLDAY